MHAHVHRPNFTQLFGSVNTVSFVCPLGSWNCQRHIAFCARYHNHRNKQCHRQPCIFEQLNDTLFTSSVIIIARTRPPTLILLAYCFNTKQSVLLLHYYFNTRQPVLLLLYDYFNTRPPVLVLLSYHFNTRPSMLVLLSCCFN